MIFLTVGSQIPFDRLVRAVDDWCANAGGAEVFGQIAETGEKGYRPRNFDWRAFLAPEEFDRRFKAARLIVGHAGMGTIISALTYQRQLLMLPRRVHLSETRNDHQVATASHFGDRPGLFVAADETKIPALLDRLTNEGPAGSHQTLGPFADQDLVSAVRAGILGGRALE